ncbi:MAG: anti-sigma F factor [Clostridia bacterium]|nr:anti-sigma F factor [Clostridia bacterium]
MTVNNYLKLLIPARSVNEGFARAAVAAFASQLDPTLSDITEIKTAVSEAVTNAIVHAYKDTMGEIRIRARIINSDTLEVSVSDKGSGIEDIEQARTPLFTTCETGERSGMGFTIMESFMDSVKVTSRVGYGTKVVMRKRIITRQ